MYGLLLSITTCLGIFLILFFLFFKRDTRFLFNRYYLLVTFLLSIFLPLIPWPAIENEGILMDMHEGIIQGGQTLSSIVIDTPMVAKPPIFEITWLQIFTTLWVFGGLLMIIRFLLNLKKIVFLMKKKPHFSNNGVHYIYTKTIQQPFTFLRTVFLPAGETPQPIFKHEEVHARQLHSIDLIILELALILFWFHPLFWLYRNLIVQNHEYQADQTTIKTLKTDPGKINKYSKLILSYATHSGNTSFMGSPFSYFFIKNRIIMLTKNRKSPAFFKLGTTTGIVTLLFIVFSFMKIEGENKLHQITSGKYKVVIDLGHGGKDFGSKPAASGSLTEKEILYQLSEPLKKEAIERGIEIYFTRNSDKYVALKDRVSMSNDFSPNLLISLHINEHENPEISGAEVYYHGESNKSAAENFISGFRFRGNLSSQPKEVNYYILKESNSPAIMIEMGFISNDTDYQYLSNKSNYADMARNVFDGIERVLNK